MDTEMTEERCSECQNRGPSGAHLRACENHPDVRYRRLGPWSTAAEWEAHTAYWRDRAVVR